MSRYKLIVILGLAFGFIVFQVTGGMAVEPVIGTYTSYPVYSSASTTPNIMVILDNSGSMNFLAYGTWPGDSGTATDAPYSGEPYGSVINAVVGQYQDDAEEKGPLSGSSVGYTYSSSDLDLARDTGSTYPDQIVGVRFTGLAIPKNATIEEAYITFNTDSVYPSQNNITLRVQGQKNLNPPRFEYTYYNISGRTRTSAYVDWTVTPWTTTNVAHQTADLKTIVQELVNQDGWDENSPTGRSMVFIFTNPAGIPGSGRPATARDASSTRMPQLYIKITKESYTRYYGYFNPDYFYQWNSSKFVPVYKKIEPVGDPSSGGYWVAQNLAGTSYNLYAADIVSQQLWDGNWVNWLSMRRVDVLRKVLMGGLATSRTGGGNQVNYGETPAQSSRVWYRWYDGGGVSPYNGNYKYKMESGSIKVYNSSGSYLANYPLRIQKDVNIEPQDFYEGNLAGVLQRVGDQANWGNMWFNEGDGNNESGGNVANRVGGNLTNLITTLQNQGCDTWTPLGEAYYVCMQYFAQQAVQSGLDYPNGCTGPLNATFDPYVQDGQTVECAKSFVLYLTDGASTMDEMIPTYLRGYDNFSPDLGTFVDNGSDYLRDIALYARVNDLRGDLSGDQNLLLYPVYAFGDEEIARQLLQSAARNGGFEDINGNMRPDLDEEWDEDGDGIPDTYFEATDGYALERQLLAAITDILKRASSGTAVSVLATSSEGEGTLVQAYFKPSVSTGITDVKWVGYLHSLWVDNQGRLREDTRPQDMGLVETQDKIVEFFFNTSTGQAMFNRFSLNADGEKAYVDTNGNGVKDDDESYIYTEHLIDELEPLWEAGFKLAERAPSSRTIYTFIDQDNDQVVDGGEFIPFTTGNMAGIKPYLGVKDATSWAYLGASPDDRATNLIKFTRGDDSGWTGTPTLRNRTITVSGAWKLSDIVNSTPVTIGRPLDNYGVIYGDQSYQDYYNLYKNREQVVYVGSNNGMLHAFLLGKFNSGDNPSTVYTESSYLTKTSTEEFGDELWSFIPQSLLPHLKWLASEDYTHVYYVDLKPRIVDARIFTPDPNLHPNGWGTVLIGGLNLGGKTISATDDFPEGANTTRTFTSTFFAIDITNPNNPVLLWERSFANLGLTTAIPAVARVNGSSAVCANCGKWYAVIGSGPQEYDGTSSQRAHIYVLDLATGAMLRDYQANENSAFMASPITVDVGLNYNVDVGYAGETYLQGSTWRGKLYRFQIPVSGGVYDSNPANWSFSTMFSADRPVTSPGAASIDAYNNFWVYFGTGRYYSDADKVDTTDDYIYGVKDPYYNSQMYYTDPASPETGKDLAIGHTVVPNDLLNSTNISVFTDLSVSGGPEASWRLLLDYMREKDGWLVELPDGERVLTEPKILGGIVLVPSYIPNTDLCGFGGNSSLWGLYFETGTAYYEEVFQDGTETVGGKERVKAKIDLGVGMGSSVGLHLGRESGAKGYIQQSTGVVKELSLNPAFNVQSGFLWWREK